MIRVENDTAIEITVNEGCISCPFTGEHDCAAKSSVRPTHDFSYPAKCPLLSQTITVKKEGGL